MGKLERLRSLTEDWYILIGRDYHKDRDCHWTIHEKWSYGNNPTYYWSHYGYILDDQFGEEHDTYEEALDDLINFLEKAVDEEEKKEKGI